MRLAWVALAAALTVLAGVTMNLGGEGSELPPPAVIELQGKPPPDPPVSALAAPIAPPPMPPPPSPAQEAKPPPVGVTAGGQGAPRQVVNRGLPRVPVASAPLPLSVAADEEVRRHVTSSWTREYRYRDEEDKADDDDRDKCEDDDEAAEDCDKHETDNDADDERGTSRSDRAGEADS